MKRKKPYDLLNRFRKGILQTSTPVHDFKKQNKTILSKLGTEEKFPKPNKDIYKKPIVNIILHGQTLEIFPLKSVLRQGWALSPLPFNTTCNKARKRKYPFIPKRYAVLLSVLSSTTK